jgi:hypothetical protein
MKSSALETRVARLEKLLRLSALAWLALAVLALAGWSSQRPPADTLRAKELVIVDPAGVERVRLGGDLPDAIIKGKRVARGEKAAGVLLYDDTGQERSGYVTFSPSGNVGLTLDTRNSQAALFVADPEEGSALQLWHGKTLVELRSDGDGSRMSAAADRQVLVQQPAVQRMTDGTCAAYQEAKSRVSVEQVGRDCRRRFEEPACKACLD